MVNTNKEIGFYTDVFGNEITEYEQIERYTVWYEGYLFDGDTDGYNEHGYDRFEDAIALYHAYGDMIHIEDNEYGLSFDYGDWNQPIKRVFYMEEIRYDKTRNRKIF